MKIGLALGAGGARGFFHIGVLKALSKLKIKICAVSGVSFGALVGACYCLSLDPIDTENRLLSLVNKYEKDLSVLKKFFNSMTFSRGATDQSKSFGILKEIFIWNLCLTKQYLIEPKPFILIFKELFSDKEFSDCKIPFFVSTLDLVSGKLFFLENGPLYKAIIASTAIPGFFPPYKFEDKILVDGGVLESIPAKVLVQKSFDFIIGVGLDVLDNSSFQFKNVVDILCLTDKIRYKKILEDNLKEADFAIVPKLDDIGWADFEKARQLIKDGEEFTLSLSSKLLKALKTKTIVDFFNIKKFFK